MGAKTKKGNTTWSDSSVRGIIKNEKYVGDILMGKTFTLDPISKRRLDNFGEEEKYYVKKIIMNLLYQENNLIKQKKY